MALSRTFSSKTPLTLHCPSLLLLSRGKHNNLLLTWMSLTNIKSRWLFYSAVNSVTPQIVLNLGFEDNSWSISIRQLAYSVTTLVVSIPITYVNCLISPTIDADILRRLYATKYKDLKSPLIVTFVIFLVV